MIISKRILVELVKSYNSLITYDPDSLSRAHIFILVDMVQVNLLASSNASFNGSQSALKYVHGSMSGPLRRFVLRYMDFYILFLNKINLKYKV